MKDQNVLLRIRRKYTESEAVQAVEKELMAAKFEIGVLKSELQELKEQNVLLSQKYISAKIKLSKQARTHNNIIVSENAPQRLIKKLVQAQERRTKPPVGAESDNMKDMKRVSKETAVILKEKGYDSCCSSYIVDSDGSTLYIPTLHEVTDWMREKGVHVCVFISVDRKTGKPFWYFELVDLKTLKYIREGVGSLTFDDHDTALEAGIVNGLRYIS